MNFSEGVKTPIRSKFITPELAYLENTHPKNVQSRVKASNKTTPLIHMLNYLIRRLLLLPITLFCIILVNFVIINMAPGDPVTVTDISPEGSASRSADRAAVFGSDDRYLQFRERYGLTLPILFNTWPWITLDEVEATLKVLITHRYPGDLEDISTKDYDALRVQTGDQARYIMPQLLHIVEDRSQPLNMRSIASRFFSRGGTRQAFLGANITDKEKEINNKIAADNLLLRQLVITSYDTKAQVDEKVAGLVKWYEDNAAIYDFSPSEGEKLSIFFFQTRFYRYMSRVLTLDFGTLRNDDNKTVIGEVTSRFKYSLTLSMLPMLFTFVLCQLFGCLMAYHQHRWQDYTFNVFFLILYAIPVFVVAPFLIQEVALNHTFPFTDIPIPISGFTSPDSIYAKQNSYQRLFDVLTHICLPIIAVMYGSLAAQSRLSRTAVLEVLRQDYVRTAWAKGVPPATILVKHVGRNASITVVTALASSLGVLLGGSLIVETLFEINGFGKFFYDAVINRDYNVIMFSSLAGAFLSLIGYLIADIAYTILDPRITLE